MHQRIVSLLLAFLLFGVPALVIQPTSVSAARTPFEKAEPAYAKWGKLAMQEAGRRYPQAQIIDYLHVGREALTMTTARETFKLWLRQGDREWGVFVRITFETRTHKILEISCTETAH
jgi:hypothetical protein